MTALSKAGGTTTHSLPKPWHQALLGWENAVDEIHVLGRGSPSYQSCAIDQIWEEPVRLFAAIALSSSLLGFTRSGKGPH